MGIWAGAMARGTGATATGSGLASGGGDAFVNRSVLSGNHFRDDVSLVGLWEELDASMCTQTRFAMHKDNEEVRREESQNTAQPQKM